MDEFKNEFNGINECESDKADVAENVLYQEEKDSAEIDIDNNTVDVFGDTDETVYFDESDDLFAAPISETASQFETVKFTPVEAEEKNASKRGLRVFSIILALVILVSGSCLGGYYIGKNTNMSTGNKINVDLDSKPKDTDEYTAAQVYDTVNESVVGIRVYNAAGSASDASGVIYSKDGYIITNDHSYSEIAAPSFKIYTHDGKEYTAQYVAGDIVSDLAVLKIKESGDFKPAKFGNSNELVCGENVVAIGRPSDATAASSISKGIISSVSRRMTTTSSYSARLIQTDSAINPGSSGGALVNMYGQVIGITSSKLAGVEYDAVGFAIPTVTMKRVVEQLIEKGKVVDRAKLGISYTEINSVTAEISGYPTTGLYIATVDEESDLYGKVTEGAVITHINGEKITNDDMVLNIIDDSKAGDTINLTINLKNNTVKDFKVTLRANVGQSSYSDTLKSQEGSSSDGTFDFPFGE